MRQGRADLEAHEPVAALRLVIQRAQPVGGLPDVLHRERLVDGHDGFPFGGEPPDIGVVVVAARDGFFENGRIGGYAAHTLIDQGL